MSVLDPTPVDERQFTPFAQLGWSAWNSYSPEVEFCQFVGLLAKMLSPKVIVETGVGAGRVTEQLDLRSAVWLGFESDEQWRSKNTQTKASPTSEQLASADLVILDSDPRYRLGEIGRWGVNGKPGSVCVVHDAGNGHPQQYETHHSIHRAITVLRIPGVFMRNPRGAWLGIHP